VVVVLMAAVVVEAVEVVADASMVEAVVDMLMVVVAVVASGCWFVAIEMSSPIHVDPDPGADEMSIQRAPLLLQRSQYLLHPHPRLFIRK
jgi:hypothetical protein